MERNKIVYMDGYDSVRDAETQSHEIFSLVLPTELSGYVGRTHIPSNVIDNVVNIFNSSTTLEDLDTYLLYEGEISQDEREIIIESLYKFKYTYNA